MAKTTKRNPNPLPRYYVSIKTEPHGQWTQPFGWDTNNIEEARAMLERAGRMWLAARLNDGHTGRRLGTA
jgi:hypothetical protein